MNQNNRDLDKKKSPIKRFYKSRNIHKEGGKMHKLQGWSSRQFLLELSRAKMARTLICWSWAQKLKSDTARAEPSLRLKTRLLFLSMLRLSFFWRKKLMASSINDSKAVLHFQINWGCLPFSIKLRLFSIFRKIEVLFH